MLCAIILGGGIQGTTVAEGIVSAGKGRKGDRESGEMTTRCIWVGG